MSESKVSPWAAPAEKPAKTAQEILEDRYRDRADPADIEDMRILPGESVVTASENEAVTPPEPSFPVGTEVTIRRKGKNGNPDYIDGGWKVFAVNAKVHTAEGLILPGVVVEKTDKTGRMTKGVPFDVLMELNTPPEKLTLTEAQEDMADEAIEDAIGLVDPEDIENARMFKPGELQAMREAARRIVYEEPLDARTPTIPNLQEMMSGERAPVAPEQAPETLEDLEEEMSADDLVQLGSYARAKQDERDYHKQSRAGQRVADGVSQEAAQNATWAYNHMTPAAQAIASRYDKLYNK